MKSFKMKFRVDDWVAIYGIIKIYARTTKDIHVANGWNVLANEILKQLDVRGYGEVATGLLNAKTQEERDALWEQAFPE